MDLDATTALIKCKKVLTDEEEGGRDENLCKPCKVERQEERIMQTIIVTDGRTSEKGVSMCSSGTYKPSRKQQKVHRHQSANQYTMLPELWHMPREPGTFEGGVQPGNGRFFA